MVAEAGTGEVKMVKVGIAKMWVAEVGTVGD